MSSHSIEICVDSPAANRSTTAQLIVAKSAPSAGSCPELTEIRCLNPSFFLKLPQATLKALAGSLCGPSTHHVVPSSVGGASRCGQSVRGTAMDQSAADKISISQQPAVLTNSLLHKKSVGEHFKMHTETAAGPDIQTNRNDGPVRADPSSHIPQISAIARKPPSLPLLAPRPTSTRCLSGDEDISTTFFIIPWTSKKTSSNDDVSAASVSAIIPRNSVGVARSNSAEYSSTTFRSHSPKNGSCGRFPVLKVGRVEGGVSPVNGPNGPFQSEIMKNKETLKRKLMQRAPAKELVARGILPGNITADPFIVEKVHQLKKCKLVDSLNDKLAHRPGPLELVRENILHVDADLQQAIKDGRIQFTPTSKGSANKRPDCRFFNIVEGPASEHSHIIHSTSSNVFFRPPSFTAKYSNSQATFDCENEPIRSINDPCVMIASKPNLLQTTPDSYANIAIQSPYSQNFFENPHSVENSPPAVTNDGGDFSFCTPTAENSTNDAPKPEESPKGQKSKIRKVKPVGSCNNKAKGGKFAAKNIKVVGLTKSPCDKGIFDGITVTSVAETLGLTRQFDVSMAESDRTASHLPVDGGVGGVGGKCESSYDLMLQQQNLMLQWEAELKQKYPKATVHFVHAPLVKEACNKLAVGDFSSSDFIDIDAFPSATNQISNGAELHNGKDEVCTLDSNLTSNLSSPSKSSLTPSSSSCASARPEKSAKERKLARKLEEMKVQDLKFECRLRNVLATGSKSSLVERLKPYEEAVLESERHRRFSAQPANTTDISTPEKCDRTVGLNVETSAPSKSPPSCLLPPISFLSSYNVGLMLNDDRNTPTPIYAGGHSTSSLTPPTFNISDQSQATYACLAPPAYCGSAAKVHSPVSSIAGNFGGVVSGVAPPTFLSINQSGVVDSLHHPFPTSPNRPTIGQAQSASTAQLSTADFSPSLPTAQQNHMNLTPPIFIAPPTFSIGQLRTTSTNSESAASSSSMDHSGITSPQYSSPGLDLSALNFSASPVMGGASSLSTMANAFCMDAGSTLIGGYPSSNAQLQHQNVLLYVQGARASFDSPTHNIIDDSHSAPSTNHMARTHLILDNPCDISGHQKMPVFSLNEDTLKNQKNKIEELQRQLQRSQDVLKQQQELILAAKKAQADNFTDIQHQQQQILCKQQQQLHHHHQQQQHQQNELVTNGSSSVDNMLSQLDTKQMQKLHIQTFLQQKLQQQQLQQLNVQRELVATQQKVEQEMQVHQSVSEVVRILRQEPKIAVLILNLLKKYQNQGEKVGSAEMQENLAQRHQVQLHQLFAENQTSISSALNQCGESKMSISNCHVIDQDQILSSDQNDVTKTNSRKVNQEIDAKLSDEKSDDQRTIKSGQLKKFKLKRSCATSKSKDANEPAKPKITRKYTKHKTVGQNPTTKLIRKMPTTASRVASLSLTSATMVDGSGDPSSSGANVSVDMEDIFRSVLDCSATKLTDGVVVDAKVGRENADCNSKATPVGDRKFSDVAAESTANCHKPIDNFHPSNHFNDQLFVYTKNEAFDDLMEVLRDNDAIPRSPNAGRNSAPVVRHCSAGSGAVSGAADQKTSSSSAPASVGFPCGSLAGGSNRKTVDEHTQAGTATIQSDGPVHASTFLNAFSAQDMADLLSSDWFNVDSILNHSSMASIQCVDNAQGRNETIATPPASYTPVNSFERLEKSDRQHMKTDINIGLNGHVTDFHGSTPMECWFDFILPSSSPSVTSSTPPQNYAMHHFDLDSDTKSVKLNQADSTTTDLVAQTPPTADDQSKSLTKIFNDQSKLPSIFGNDLSETSALFSDQSESTSNLFVDQSSSSACRHDPLLLRATPTNRNSTASLFSMSDDCL